MRVAVLGTGLMGGAMAQTIAAADHDVVVWNRTRRKAEEVAGRAGAEVRGSPREAVADADVVISMLADRHAVEGVYLGDDGAIAGLREGTVAVEMSTVEPVVVRSLADAVRERGADVIDSPVSGSVPAVRSGTLTLMVGGDAAALDRARPALEPLATHVFHLGDLGNGAAAKLVVNGVVHAINQALSEALVLAESAGIERSAIYDVLTSGAAAAPFLQYKREAFEHPDTAPVAFRLALARKDLDLITAFADEVGAPMPQARTNREVATDAERTHGERDMSALAVYLRERAG